MYPAERIQKPSASSTIIQNKKPVEPRLKVSTKAFILRTTSAATAMRIARTN